jgi:serine/threonine protein kinase
MSIKYKINPNFKNDFEEFLLNIKEYFAQNNQTIHKARNELKVITFSGIETVVKAFKVPNIVNQFAYAYLRDSKAKKSFENGMKLVSKNHNTPEPIGYIEFYDKGLLKESYFVSLKQNYDFLIREPLYNSDFKDRKNIIKQFSEFTYSLHKNDIFHKDYSAGNTLVVDNGNSNYEFYIVDINRMQFKNIDLNLAMENFNKLWANNESLIIIAKEYSKLGSYDENECIDLILKKDKELKEFVENRRKWKKRVLGK